MNAKMTHNYLNSKDLFISLENPEVKSEPTGVSTFASRTSRHTSQSLQKSMHFQPHRQSITADIQITTERTPATNTGLAKVPVQCSASTFVVKIANFL